jgi:dihydrodipicolinate synthase/N-acetylneuraminate lyase
MEISGIIPPMVTPFCADESIDFEKLKSEVHRLRSANVHGLSFAGSTGEGAVLNDNELYQGIELLKKESGDDVPIICGIIRNSTQQGISAASAAKEAGADALMITPTYYFGSDARGNVSYFSDIFEATKMPIIIYNVINNNRIYPSDIESLRNIDGVIGIKQSVGGVHAIADMIYVCGNNLTVFAAQDDVMFLSFACGAKGAISAILTLFPDLFVEQWQAVRDGDLDRARMIHERVLPVWRAIEGVAFPGRLKTALNIIGIPVGHARKPILKTNKSAYELIKKRLFEAGFIK